MFALVQQEQDGKGLCHPVCAHVSILAPQYFANRFFLNIFFCKKGKRETQTGQWYSRSVDLFIIFANCTSCCWHLQTLLWGQIMLKVVVGVRYSSYCFGCNLCCSAASRPACDLSYSVLQQMSLGKAGLTHHLTAQTQHILELFLVPYHLTTVQQYS